MKHYVAYLLAGIFVLVTPPKCRKDQPTDNPIPCYERAQFGDPSASEYVLPFLVGAGYYCIQSYCNPDGGHKNQLAYDFSLSIGDTVCAARSGIVRSIREDQPDTGGDISATNHNFIMIQHADGTVAFYAHLKQYSVFVSEGESVKTGDVIALSGNSGNTVYFPHLHFGVYQGWPATETYDVAVNFRNADGPLDARGGLMADEKYTALEY